MTETGPRLRTLRIRARREERFLAIIEPIQWHLLVNATISLIRMTRGEQRGNIRGLIFNGPISTSMSAMRSVASRLRSNAGVSECRAARTGC